MLKVPYDPVNDFIPISLIATNDVVIVINPKLAPTTPPAELIAYLKANPGKLQYGSSGIGTRPISPPSCSRAGSAPT